MILLRHRKQPREVHKVTVDYRGRYGEDCDSVASVEIIIEPPPAEPVEDTSLTKAEVEELQADTSPAYDYLEVTPVIAPDGGSVQLFVEKGVDGEDYTVTVLSTTAVDKLKYEDEVIILVNEVP